ncbi:MAG: hypothetical protein P0Y65_05090 [Candidatus Devosia phytovorans]|uniref:Uncharacterized protein n=1 Tax=Candidatus Devosia phytovorans TaxID=3121372 RepID=A0AAJ6B0W1_9HYPH|nr:hypothetical protein [Devosia sp.]WEK05632.1 MAG: hypothetical protein P0Y65_05090 [Devosia sp.]
MRFSALSSLTLLAGMTLVSPAYAFDDIFKAIGLMPGAIEQPKAFDYLAPSLGFSNADPNTFGVIDDLDLAAALIDSKLDPATGIDFGRATGVITLGAAPENTTVIFGEPGFADGAHDALLARDFTDSEDGEITIYARGEDNAIDLAASEPDPLGSGMGKAQRLAVAPDYVMRTGSWPLINQSLLVMHDEPAFTKVWADTLRGMQQVSEDGATLELASGWTLFAFTDSLPTFEPEASGKTKNHDAGVDPLLAFPLAIIGLTRGQETAALHIAMPYGSPELAEQAGEIIVERLADFRMDVPEPKVTIIPAGGDAGALPTLIVTMENYESDIVDLQDLYLGFIAAIYQRDFKPLMAGL